MRPQRNEQIIEDFRQFLAQFPVGKPTLKVNGSSFATAVIVVDFGSPLEPIRLNGEQSSELNSRMRELTTALTGRRNVRIQPDHQNGIYWASI